MAKKDPAFVRIHSAYAYGMMADISDYGSLWHISGLHVKPFPTDDPLAAAYVRSKISKGQIEAASEDEYNFQTEAANTVRAMHAQSLADRIGSDRANVQEGSIDAVVRKTQQRIIAGRLNEPVDEADDDDSGSSGSGKSQVPAGAAAGGAGNGK